MIVSDSTKTAMLAETNYGFVDFHDSRNIDPLFLAILLYSLDEMKEKQWQKPLP